MLNRLRGAYDREVWRWAKSTFKHVWRWARQRPWMILILGVSLGAWLLFRVMESYVEPATPAERINLMQIVVASAGGALVAIGSIVAWRNYQVNQQSLHLSREGQITDRFTRAIEQLGAVNSDGSIVPEVRLGGIYALKRIAQDSVDDHWTIMEILTAYVRTHSSFSDSPELTGHSRFPVHRSIQGLKAKPSTAPPNDLSLSLDVRAAMGVIVHRKHVASESASQRLNLEGTELMLVDLQGGKLAYANLKGSRLYAADLSGADLREAVLEFCNLERAMLEGVDMSGAVLTGVTAISAVMSEAVMIGVTAYRADFSNANLDGAILRGAKLTGCDFSSASLKGADFTGANLDDVNFNKAKLNDAILTGVRLGSIKNLTQHQIDRTIRRDESVR